MKDCLAKGDKMTKPAAAHKSMKKKPAKKTAS